MRAMPSACQPSKNAGSSSTQRRYFSTAASNSPMARSPFASSKSSSSGDMRQLPSGLGLRGQVFLKSSCAAPFVEPFVEDDHAFALEIILFEARLRGREPSWITWLARFEERDETAGLGRHEISRIARIHFAHRALDGSQIGNVRLFLLGLER